MNFRNVTDLVGAVCDAVKGNHSNPIYITLYISIHIFRSSHFIINSHFLETKPSPSSSSSPPSLLLFLWIFHNQTIFFLFFSTFLHLLPIPSFYFLFILLSFTFSLPSDKTNTGFSSRLYF